jgi:protein phosphatase
MVSDDGILSIATLVQNPTEACNRLVEMANKNGGKDNITVIMATFLKEGRWFSVFSNFWKWFGR